MRSRWALACGVFFSFYLANASAERVALPKPIQVSLQKTDKTHVAGRITAWDADGFDLIVGKDVKESDRWDEFDARTVFQTRAELIGNRDGKAWLDLGKALQGFENGKDWSQRAFDRALKIDPKLKDEVRDAKSNAHPASAPVKENSAGMGQSAARQDAGAGPRTVGRTQEEFWGKQTEATQAEQVAVLKKFADQTQKQMSRPLGLLETKFFLFYSDLSPQEAAKWAGLLDRMYARLADMFGVPKGENVWRGKGLILVFTKADDYRRFERQLHRTDPGESAGMAHCYGDGLVHIAFYRQPQDLTFAHVLVHESVHGFLHRYRAAPFIPSWANEGLAEVIASELVPNPGHHADNNAREQIQSHGNSMGNFFTTDHIEGWQYPVAESFCGFMIKAGKKNYVDFINGIKDGMPWQESLEQKYKAPLERLVPTYGATLGIKGMKP